MKVKFLKGDFTKISEKPFSRNKEVKIPEGTKFITIYDDSGKRIDSSGVEEGEKILIVTTKIVTR